ncbi:MAG TPA: insulinase family protein, partial [Bacteroidia bacterium]|nr:insulinase family protein [Bacteroidia bacterium]
MKHVISAISLYVLIAFQLQAQTSFIASTAKDKNGSTFQSVSNDPLKARIYTLSNGLKVYLSRYTDAPRIQTFIAVHAGSKNDPANTTGLAHYLEHILFKGTSKIGTSNWEAEKVELDKIEALYQVYRTTADTASRRQIYHQIDSVSVVAAGYAIANEYDKMLSQIGAQGTNAYTFVEQTVYVNDIPSNQIQKWAEIEAERFSMVVPRLFHTELEAVYEEKNKGLDQDSRKVWETTFASLFLKDPYGTQTTIGTVEHLKNPSITEIKKYFSTYYVANNMAICMSGDLDYDSTITMLEDYFSSLPNKPVPAFTPPVEDKITSPIHKIVLGPSAESISIAYRLDVSIPQDPTFRSKLKMIQMLLTNGQAGIIDLNVNQAQKAMGAYSYEMPLKDYSIFMMGAKPIAGQSLEDLEAILLKQIDELKFGHFDEWLIKAVVNDYKMSTMQAYESNKNRADAFVDAFIWGIEWNQYLEEINTLEKMTKADIQQFCITNFNTNYVVVYKKKGTDISIQKVPKPKISTVSVNRDSQSEFYKKVFSTPSPVLLPVFLDYSKEISQDAIKTLPILYKMNKENTLFTQEYIWTLPRKYDPTYNLMVSYVNYLGSETFTPEALKEEFYKLGCSYSFKISANEFSISLAGLQENYSKALSLLESFIKTIKPDDGALGLIKANALKTRNDNKSSKDIILRSALASYAKYDGTNPFTNIIPESKLNTLTSDDILKYLKTIYQKPHKIIYYGPADLKTVKTITSKTHTVTIVPAGKSDSGAVYTF